MALRGASTTTDTDFIDWMSLAVEGAAVVLTVTEIEPEKDYGSGNGPIEVPIADVVVLTGAQAGARYDGERVFKAGIRNRLKVVGESIVGRMATYNRGKTAYPCLNSEEVGDLELAEKALAKASGKKATASKKAADDGDEPPF